MQKILYFCIVKSRIRIILAILFLLPSFQGRAGDRPSFNLDDIVLDIYNAATEIGEVDYEQLQTDLYALHEAPINLNNTSDEELQQLYFLSPQQIDDILAYADRHPFETLYELRMIQSLADYEIRDLLPFVRIGARASERAFREVPARLTPLLAEQAAHAACLHHLGHVLLRGLLDVLQRAVDDVEQHGLETLRLAGRDFLPRVGRDLDLRDRRIAPRRHGDAAVGVFHLNLLDLGLNALRLAAHLHRLLHLVKDSHCPVPLF